MTSIPRPWRRELGALTRLALPVATVQVGLYAMGAVDAAFMGRVSEREFAAVALGHALSFALLGLAMGVLVALDPIVSQAHGAREEEAVSRALQRGLVLALLLSAGVAFALLFAEPILVALNQPSGVIPRARDYMHISIAGVPGFLLFVAQRQTLQATHRLRPLVIVILVTNVLNATLDWILIGGHLGAPAMGADGCAWATVAARWAMALALPWAAGVGFRGRLWPIRPGLWDARAFLRMLHVGVPIGLSFGLEIGAFSCVLVFMGQLGERQLAGHQVVMSLASASFMVPLSISMAAAVRVGNAIGRGEPAAMRRSVHVALALGTLLMSVTGVLFFVVPAPLARLFTDLPEVLAIAVVLLPIAGLFQVFDGLQGVAHGCLRGMADTRVPFLIHLFGFWGVAIPMSAWLGLQRGHGARGLWWGLALGLLFVALVQVWRVHTRLRAGVGRVVIESEGT